ncbi:hypothetical protein BV898_08865 [Hypsibius exemplaris]|uniref:Uncharacterized protein n=1 Tax=Hypsibius exemplaris TaxID=2072580 RepID=A0A1W0WP65_HYPEX|nr:hypothetical protein BV898_08865 [Hypsibius exemplaris]
MILTAITTTRRPTVMSIIQAIQITIHTVLTVIPTNMEDTRTNIPMERIRTICIPAIPVMKVTTVLPILRVRPTIPTVTAIHHTADIIVITMN